MPLTEVQRAHIMEAFDQVEASLLARGLSLQDTPFASIKNQLLSDRLDLQEAIVQLRNLLAPFIEKPGLSGPNSDP